MAGFGDLAQWLRSKARSDPPALSATLPEGDGPLILLAGPAAGDAGLAAELCRRRPGLRLGILGPAPDQPGGRNSTVVLPALPADAASARALIELAKPAALVLSDAVLPPALVLACDEAGVPVTLVSDAARIAAGARDSLRTGHRNVLVRLSRVLVPDRAAEDAALREGIAPQRIEIVGSALPILPPIPCDARELGAMRPLLRDRPVWLAAALPLSEVTAVLAAQTGLLTVRHRALLIVAPARAQDADAIDAAAATRGLTVARRELQDPSPETQVLLAEDSSEMGLWYRLATITYAGGTLTRQGADARHPFEPAALGTAIVHGPMLSDHLAEWQALDRAGGARHILGPLALPQAIEELSAPDAAARLSRAAWEVATAGAEITCRIAEAVLSDVPETS